MGSREAHLPRLNTAMQPIENKYREGKVKRTPITGSEREPETVCLQAVSVCRSATSGGLWRAFCLMSRRVTVGGEVNAEIGSRSESESEEGASGLR